MMVEQRRWVLVDASTAGTVRFGSASPGSDQIDAIISLSATPLPTFTDALLAYERQSGTPLLGCECVLAVPAPPAGDAIKMMRSHWTISRAGLNAVFGHPVVVINDVAATAWSLLGSGFSKVEHFGGPRFDFTRPGRWAVILLDDGINAAAPDVADGGRSHVTDGEGGHGGFPPSDDREIELLRHLRQRSPHVSWEIALNAGWAEPHAPAADRDAWAAMAGSYVGDCVLQLGAWSGVILTGRHVATLRDPHRQAMFTRRLEEKSRYGRFLAAGSRGFLAVRDPIAGGLALLTARQNARFN